MIAANEELNWKIVRLLGERTNPGDYLKEAERFTMRGRAAPRLAPIPPSFRSRVAELRSSK